MLYLKYMLAIWFASTSQLRGSKLCMIGDIERTSRSEESNTASGVLMDISGTITRNAVVRSSISLHSSLPGTLLDSSWGRRCILQVFHNPKDFRIVQNRRLRLSDSYTTTSIDASCVAWHFRAELLSPRQYRCSFFPYLLKALHSTLVREYTLDRAGLKTNTRFGLFIYRVSNYAYLHIHAGENFEIQRLNICNVTIHMLHMPACRRA